MEENVGKVKDYMSDRVMTVRPDDTLGEITKLIRNTFHDCYPVLRNGSIVGIITSWDVIQKRRSRKVEEVMTKEVVVTFPDTNLTDAARVMYRRGLSKMPVIDENRKLVGIVTATDIIRSHIERVTPTKLKKLTETLEKLYSVKTSVRLGRVKISEILPTQSIIHPDEFIGRKYEIKRGLAEPIVVIKSGERWILVDGHHRSFAAVKMGIEEIDAYIVWLSKDIELGLEKTAKVLGLSSVRDIQIVEESEKGIAEVIREE
ncbi:MAG: CBS domain-containing protein [Candidatus Hydrothermarchaeaceae archaeon]